MNLFGRKEKNISESIKDILKIISEILDTMSGLLEFIYNEDWEKTKELVYFIRSKESEADSIRRETEFMLYSGAFLPGLRGDLLELVESIDNIADRAESIADALFLQRMKIPENLRRDILRQFLKSKETFETLRIACEGFFEDIGSVREKIIEVENREHEEDSIERELIEKLFSSDLPLANKLQLNQLIKDIGDIADLSEDVSDILEIIVMKRRM
ncbi:MAG: uncharacterized protein PWQ20_1038 [Thermotogaceae bacterium]|jgi:hypothetical protein|nr:uncharacterized protein [Thermotogaceae bacterium]MDN5337968.1 uncharacterized protein [Thermotogaceae bacterium]